MANAVMTPMSTSDRDAVARARYLRVLGEPTRLRLLEALRGDERTVSQLVELVGAPRSRVSNHLACLKWCGLATDERRGREVVYRVADERVHTLLDMSGRLSDEQRDRLVSCRRIGPDWI